MSAPVAAIAIGLLIAVLAALAIGALREDTGSRVKGGARRPMRGFLHWVTTGEFLLPPAPYVPAREIADCARGPEPLERAPAAGASPVLSGTGEARDDGLLEEWKEAHRIAPTPRTETPAGWDAIRAGMPARAPMSPDPAQVPFTGWRVPDDWQPHSDAHLPGGRGLMRVGRPPWDTAQQPVLPPEPMSGPARAWDPGDGTTPPVPLARPYLDRPLGLADLGPADPRPLAERAHTNG